MSKSINITNAATPLLQRLQGAVHSGGLANAMGAGARNRIQAHLIDYNAAHPNRLGGRRTNFYTKASKATFMSAVPGEITVTIKQQGFRQRLQGGRIRPVSKKFLTIPATAEAHGKTAGEFPDLQFAIIGGRPALVRARQTNLQRTRGKTPGFKAVSSATGTEVLFWLVKAVNQKPDPSVLPTDAEIAAAAIAAGEALIAELKKGGGNG